MGELINKVHITNYTGIITILYVSKYTTVTHFRLAIINDIINQVPTSSHTEDVWIEIIGIISKACGIIESCYSWYTSI